MGLTHRRSIKEETVVINYEVRFYVIVRWWSDDDPTLNAGWVALWFSMGLDQYSQGNQLGSGPQSTFSDLYPHKFFLD